MVLPADLRKIKINTYTFQGPIMLHMEAIRIVWVILLVLRDFRSTFLDSKAPLF